MKVLFLYIEVMGYTMATIKALTELGCEVHIVHWDKKKITPYRMPELNGVFSYPRSQIDLKKIESIINKISPDIVIVSGWQDPLYVKVAKRLRKRGKYVVGSMDQQWNCSPRQFVAFVLGQFGYFKKIFSHIWVSGVYQFEYARMLGYKKNKIIFDLYSADINVFDMCSNPRVYANSNEYPHIFLFIGRYEHIKGLTTLLTAWHLLGDSKRDWKLYLIGTGSMKNTLSKYSNIVLKDFMQPEELISEINNAGCFIMPSIGEPWGVVAHEIAAAGLPMIVSDAVGSASSFLISGMNGYVFKRNDADQLAQAMRRIINLPDEALVKMGQYSNILSKRITPVTSAYNLLSINVSC